MIDKPQKKMVKKIDLKNGLMGIAIATSLTAGVLQTGVEQKMNTENNSRQEQITVQGNWAAAYNMYGFYASDSSFVAAGATLGLFAGVCMCIPGGQVGAAYFGL